MQTTNDIKSANTLPKSRHNPKNLFRNANEEIAAQLKVIRNSSKADNAFAYRNAELTNKAFSCSIIGNNGEDDNGDADNDHDSDDYQNHFLTKEKQQNKMTLCAYSNSKTLPRGPYLQYKCNDRQQLAATATTVTIGQKHKIECFDNNKLRQNRQIEQLKNEFIHLPRARVLAANDRKAKNDEFAAQSTTSLPYFQKSPTNNNDFGLYFFHFSF